MLYYNVCFFVTNDKTHAWGAKHFSTKLLFTYTDYIILQTEDNEKLGLEICKHVQRYTITVLFILILRTKVIRRVIIYTHLVTAVHLVISQNNSPVLRFNIR